MVFDNLVTARITEAERQTLQRYFSCTLNIDRIGQRPLIMLNVWPQIFQPVYEIL